MVFDLKSGQQPISVAMVQKDFAFTGSGYGRYLAFAKYLKLRNCRFIEWPILSRGRKPYALLLENNRVPEEKFGVGSKVVLIWEINKQIQRLG